MWALVCILHRSTRRKTAQQLTICTSCEQEHTFVFAWDSYLFLILAYALTFIGFFRLCRSLLYWEHWAELWRLPQSLSSPFGISHPFSTVHDSFLSSWTTTTRTLAGSIVIPLRTFKKHMNLRYLTLCLLCVFPSLVFSLMISQVHDQDLSNESSYSFIVFHIFNH